jgi:hypothetical protein
MDITYRHTQVGAIEFAADASAATPSAVKGFDNVTIGIPLQFSLEGCAANQRWVLPDLNVDLRARLPGAQHLLLGSGAHVETLTPATSTLKLPKLVNVRCSPRALLQYEASRDGAPIQLRCEMRGTIYGLLQTSGRECLSDPSLIWGWIDFEFPKQTWASMLRSCELSASVFVEIPLPAAHGTQLDEGQRALLDAFEAFEHGGATAWKDSIGHVRPYLEAWTKQQPLPNEQPPKDGSDADREWKLLNLRDALYKCCHPLVHNPKSSCTRKDALLILSTFACLLEVRP